MSDGTTWRDVLHDKTEPALEREIDVFAMQIDLRKQGKIEEKLFAETRLRRGAYGQRYDNGHRHDGEKIQEIVFPSAVTKGPNTLWDAPGMLRIKIPFGGVSADQMDALAAVAEEYSDAILHVTTRQDYQLHFVHIEDCPDIMRRLAAVGLTTREACGNVVRNVTACPFSGVCNTESFDVTPYSNAMHLFLLGHEDCQSFGRKFKVAFSGCKEKSCGLTGLHDLGCIARVQGGKRGFEFYVGGGLGAVTHQAKLFTEFLPEEELLPMALAICRVFSRLGEKKNRQRARVKFLVAKLGIDEFKRLVLEERTKLLPDERFTAFLKDLHVTDDKPLKPAVALNGAARPDGYDAWARTNVLTQAQPGYFIAVVRLPLGDLTSSQMRHLARVARRFTGDTIRTTVEQNMLFRWVSEADLPALYTELKAVGLALAGADTIADITACPGTDTCKLGISSSRGLAAELTKRLGSGPQLDPAVEKLRIKTSGCFNSCAQHHIADLGFLGISRNVNGRRVPHFQVVLGGQSSQNAAAYGLALGAVPSKRIPEVVERMSKDFVEKRLQDESFQDYIKRRGKVAIKALLADLIPVPSYEEDPSYYTDWGDPREYSITDMGEGECAGEVVTFAEFGLAAAERETFEAQLRLDAGDVASASRLAYSAMIQAAKALVKTKNIDTTDDASVVDRFRESLVETKQFSDPYAGDKFAQFLFQLHEQSSTFDTSSGDDANRWVQEAVLFTDAAHVCLQRLQQGPTAAEKTASAEKVAV
ncbi:MAG: nitrite/sulfite reductase [Polyangiaceae bacterium]